MRTRWKISSTREVGGQISPFLEEAAMFSDEIELPIYVAEGILWNKEGSQLGKDSLTH